MTENQHVAGENIEPDESQTPAEFAGEEWMTLDQVAAHYGCSVVQVREYIEQGQLTPVAAGSIQRIARSEVERLGDPTAQGAREFEAEHGA
jgi:hypothetical protein